MTRSFPANVPPGTRPSAIPGWPSGEVLTIRNPPWLLMTTRSFSPSLVKSATSRSLAANVVPPPGIGTVIGFAGSKYGAAPEFR